MLNELRATPRSVSAGTRDKHNVSCAIRQCFRYTSIIVFSRRIKPHCSFKVPCGLRLLQLRRQVVRRPPDDSVSFRFSKLPLNFLTTRADDKELAMWELSRDGANEIGIRGIEKRWRHRGLYIG